MGRIRRAVVGAVIAAACAAQASGVRAAPERAEQCASFVQELRVDPASTVAILAGDRALGVPALEDAAGRRAWVAACVEGRRDWPCLCDLRDVLPFDLAQAPEGTRYAELVWSTGGLGVAWRLRRTRADAGTDFDAHRPVPRDALLPEHGIRLIRGGCPQEIGPTSP